ncbi:unnamed protein product [Fusarium equiseti]|uniref:Uncharacterized protein n=1 Tax=Fusarium equiseti TaxID=61235 RepID=A0A8J2ISI9_FUSEQ|nr:unnamed protein product [Fusarium equiseti]
MSGQIVLPDSSGVNLDDTVQRRQWMEKAFRALGLWDNLNGRPKFEGVERIVQDGLCELFDRQGWHKVSHPHFLMAYDEGLWRTALKFGKINSAEAPWPWEGHPYPAVAELTLGESEYQQSTEQVASAIERLDGEFQELRGSVAGMMAGVVENVRENNAEIIEVLRKDNVSKDNIINELHSDPSRRIVEIWKTCDNRTITWHLVGRTCLVFADKRVRSESGTVETSLQQLEAAWKRAHLHSQRGP